MSSKRVLSRVPCKTLLLLDDCASHLHKEKTSIFIFALVSVYSALHKVTAFGFVGPIRFSFTRETEGLRHSTSSFESCQGSWIPWIFKDYGPFYGKYPKNDFS